MIPEGGPSNELVSTAEVACRLGIHRVNAAMLIRNGRLPAIKVANCWLVLRDDLERFARFYRKGPGRPQARQRIEEAGMTRAALYARVSSDRQEHEETIESQVAELRARIQEDCVSECQEYTDEPLPAG